MPISRLGTSHVSIVATPIAAFLVFVVFAGGAVVRAFPPAVAPWLLGALRGALAAASLYLAAGALLVAGSLVLHAHRVTEISREVGGGLSGLPVLVIGVLFAPNAAVAGSAYLAGPGFAVGTGTTVNAFSTSHGVLPALPILGAIPDGHGANPVVLALMCLVPLIAATCIARAVRRAVATGFLLRVGGAGGQCGPGRTRAGHRLGARRWPRRQRAPADGWPVAVASGPRGGRRARDPRRSSRSACSAPGTTSSRPSSMTVTAPPTQPRRATWCRPVNLS